ncbi:MAG: hypothetical protein JXR84_04155 [Anaerolineae bacterium]|nr:hypothetical protein [Anaerolineae bacterium]
MSEETTTKVRRAWTIDISGLTGADVGKLLQVDAGELEATQEMLERTVRPSLDVVPLEEWFEARGELVRLTLAQIFRREKSG